MLRLKQTTPRPHWGYCTIPGEQHAHVIVVAGPTGRWRVNLGFSVQSGPPQWRPTETVTRSCQNATVANQPRARAQVFLSNVVFKTKLYIYKVLWSYKHYFYGKRKENRGDRTYILARNKTLIFRFAAIATCSCSGLPGWRYKPSSSYFLCYTHLQVITLVS